ncbi:4Fe-4S binding protein [Desulfonatronum parangueonense]
MAISKLLSRLLKPSTRSFHEQFTTRPNYSAWNWLHGYVYGRWPELYISIGTGRHPAVRVLRPLAALFRKSRNTALPDKQRRKVSFADTYHGKVLHLEHARQLVTVNRDIDLGDLEQIIPYATARDIVLQHPDRIVALQCPCRSSSAKPCLPRDVCLIVGEPFASFIAEHHPDKARWISRQEAQDILQAEHERGHVHHAFFKDVMLGRFYAICNCCACCCGAMNAQRNGTPMLASSGYVGVKEEDRCIQCGLCAKNCQFHAIRRLGEKYVLDAMQCMGCGVCVGKCPKDALTLVRDPSRGEPLDLRDIMTARAR